MAVRNDRHCACVCVSSPQRVHTFTLWSTTKSRSESSEKADHYLDLCRRELAAGGADAASPSLEVADLPAFTNQTTLVVSGTASDDVYVD